MDSLTRRLGLNVPDGWWPTAPFLKEIEASGFGWIQVHAPPASVLRDPRQGRRHAAALGAALQTTGLRCVVHGPGSLLVGERDSNRAFEGLLSYAAEAGAEQVVYHGRALVDEPRSEDRALAETRSLAGLARIAEGLAVTIAVENLAPVFPGPELLCSVPLALRSLVTRIGSDALGICLDVGHAHIVADLRHTSVELLIEPVLDLVALFHVHDNLGARRTEPPRADLDPLRLDLHLPPTRGTLPWRRVAPLLAAHDAPLALEVHPPNRPRPSALELAARQALTKHRPPAPAHA